MPYINDLAYDAALDFIANNAQFLVLCDGEPTTYADVNTDHATGDRLGETGLVPGDFTKAAGDASGRKTTMAQQTGISITVTGSWSAWGFRDTTNTRLVAAGLMDQARAVSSGGTATCNAFDIEFTDAV